MIKRALAVCLFTAIAFALVNAAPTTVTYPDPTPNFSITFPDGWKQKQKEPAYVSTCNADESIYIDFWALNGSTNADGEADSTDDLTKDMGTWLKDIKMERAKDQDYTAGGVRFIVYTGTANTKDGGSPEELEASLCSVDGGKTVYVIMYYGDKGAAEGATNAADLKAIFASIKKM